MSWFRRNKPEPEKPEAKKPEDDPDYDPILELLEAGERRSQQSKLHAPEFEKLTAYLNKVPGTKFDSFYKDERGWQATLSIDIDHKLAWNVVQELAFVLNGISVTERLPTSFKPQSPPPYLNGGPRDFLSWSIECSDNELSPDLLCEIIEGRLPSPVEDEAKWARD